MPGIASLRERMLHAAGLAREQHIDNRMEEYAKSRAEVDAILDQLRTLYRQQT
jgi:hypothetical protein